jgi:hypothetical protein
MTASSGSPQPAAAAGNAAVGLRRRILLARAGWTAMLAVVSAAIVVFTPMNVAQLRTSCAGSGCAYQQLSPDDVRALATAGISVSGYVLITFICLSLSIAVSWAVSALIISRRADDRMALLVALLMLVFGPLNVWVNLNPSSTFLWLVVSGLTLLNQVLFILVFLLFPNGRFTPRWMRWVFGALAIAQAAVLIAPNVRLAGYASASNIGWLGAVGAFVIVLLAQIYRYRWHSSGIERQRTKWVVFGFAVVVVVAVIFTALTVVIPPAPGQRASALSILFANEFGYAVPFFITLAFGMAMSRSRLWDIDILINRTLVYGVLVLILTVLFVGTIIGLEALLRGFIQQQNSLAVVASTLLIAALFQPLRRRIRSVIDQRFYRRKYDAARTLTRFGETLRAEVNLEALSHHLIDAVDETMQPAHVSLWLRPSVEPPPAAAD